jgi:hypothetical protein
MSPRALRRAAERQTLKLAVQATKVMTASVGSDSSPSVDLIAPPISDARWVANRANAQFSTGPRTDEGKAKSSLNAVKTGLTGRTVLMPGDDAAIYQQHIHRHFSRYSPITDEEKELVQSIADTDWRLLRIAPLEAGIYAIGRRDLAHTVSDEPDSANREALLLSNIFIIHRRDLNNIALQERRLRSQRKADIAELLGLQQARLEKENALAQQKRKEVERAGRILNNAQRHKLRVNLSDHGFEFSNEEFQAYGEANNTHHLLTETILDFHQWLATHRAAQKELKTA